MAFASEKKRGTRAVSRTASRRRKNRRTDGERRRGKHRDSKRFFRKIRIPAACTAGMSKRKKNGRMLRCCL